MKATSLLFFFVLGMFAAAAIGAEPSQAARNELAALQGEWVMVSGSADGQLMPEDLRTQMKRVCKGEEVTVTMGGQIFLKAKFTVDPSRKPKTIDYQMTGGFTKGQKQLGIYEVDGDTFRSCFGAPGAERPSEFSSRAGDHRTLSVWKKRQESAKPPEPKK